MKTISKILILGIFALSCVTLQGQVLNRINRAAQNAAERAATRQVEKRTEEAVNKAIEKTIEANEKAAEEARAAKEAKEAQASTSEPAPYTGPVREAPKDASKFPFEQGSYVQISEALGFELKTTVYFAQSGLWQAIEDKSEIKFFGMSTKMDKLHIIKGTQHWNLDLAEKTGSYYETDSTAPEDADAVLTSTLGGSPPEGVVVTELGTEDYIGYTCRKVRVQYPELAMDVTNLSYGTLVMKNEGSVLGVKTSVRVISVDLNAPPASKFEVPAGINIQ